MERFSAKTARIDGQILKRGFWLYVWEVTFKTRTVLYVGRTGDSSSRNAASPFARFSRHMDFRSNAKGNSLLTHLRNEGIDPTNSTFELLAIGPLFNEQSDHEKYIERRDKVAALECALAGHLREQGYMVLGSHNSNKQLEVRLFKKVLATVIQRFPKIEH